MEIKIPSFYNVMLVRDSTFNVPLTFWKSLKSILAGKWPHQRAKSRLDSDLSSINITVMFI